MISLAYPVAKLLQVAVPLEIESVLEQLYVYKYIKNIPISDILFPLSTETLTPHINVETTKELITAIIF